MDFNLKIIKKTFRFNWVMLITMAIELLKDKITQYLSCCRQYKY